MPRYNRSGLPMSTTDHFINLGDNMPTSIDYETYLISDGNIYPKPVCLSYYDGTSTGLLNRAEAEPYLHEILTKNELIIAHNAVFECGVTITHYPELAELVFKALDEGRFHCTYINEALWNIQREKPINKLDLASLVKLRFGTDISATKGEDAWRLRYTELDGIPIEDWPIEASKYAIDDSIWAYKLYEMQKPIDQTLALKSAVYLNLMGAEGFLIDQERVEILEQEIWDYLNPRYDFLIEQGFCTKHPKRKIPKKKTKKLTEYIESLGVDIQRTKKGGIATSGEALSSYYTQTPDPIVKAFSELIKYEYLLTTYVINLKGAPKIYTQYSTTKNTARTSSSGSKFFSSVNIQNQPREVENVTYDIRNCYIPREGFKICSIDYSGLELCSAAHQLYTTLGYSYMREALNSGDKPTDMHSKLAAKIKGISYEEFMANKSDFKDARQKAKPINLGFPGGIGYDTMRHLMWKDGIKTRYQILETARRKSDLYYYLTNLAAPDIRIRRQGKYQYALVQDELVLLKRYMFDLYPCLEQFLKDTHEKFLTGKTKWKKNEFDEWEKEPMYAYEVAGFRRDWCTYTALCNGYLMQSPSTLGAQQAMIRLNKTFYKCPDLIPQAFIHDEAVVEVNPNRLDLIEEASYILIEEMQKVLYSVRIATEASVSDYWQKADGYWTQQYFRNALC